jgi:hypothetical protein
MSAYCETHGRKFIGEGCPWCLGEAKAGKAPTGQRPVKSPDVQAAPRRLLKHGGDRRSDKFQGNAVPLNRGNTANYLLARLERDRPDLAAKVRAKELSAYAAAIEAGFRRRATGIGAPQRLENRPSHETTFMRKTSQSLENQALRPAFRLP